MTPIVHEKNRLRRELSARRARLSAAERSAADSALQRGLHALIAPGGRVACYWPTATEPGGSDLVPTLAGWGCTVFLPRCLPGGELAWGEYTGPESVTAGAYGITEPAKATQSSARLLPTVDLVVVPALAAGPDGSRLGKGAGYYDRALAGITTPTVAMVYTHEFRTVPTQVHDSPVSMVLTPHGNHHTV